MRAPEKKNSQHSQDEDHVSHERTCRSWHLSLCLGLTLCHISIPNLYHEWYFVAIPLPGVVKYLRAWHRCDRQKSQWLFFNSRLLKNKNKQVFYLDKVYYPAILCLVYFLWTWTNFMCSCINFTIYFYCSILKLYFG